MVKFFIGGIVFALIAIAIIVMVIINFSYRGVKKIREEAEDRYYRNQKMKEQKEKNPFGDDYFKSSSGSKQGRKQQSQYEQKQQSPRSGKSGNAAGRSNATGTSGNPGSSSSQQQTTTRRTTTSSGVTIIDDRDTGEKRKIFDHSDGEYVEFTEVDS